MNSSRDSENAERVFAVALAAFGPATACVLGPRNSISGDILAITREHEFAIAAPPESQRRLRNILLRHSDFAAALHVGKLPLANHLLHGALDLRLVASQKALPIDETLAATVGAAVNELKHRWIPLRQKGMVKTTCAHVDTTPPAGAPASRYSPWSPYAATKF